MIIAILLGLTLRLSMFIIPKSIWGDEVYSVWASQQPLSTFWSLNHPPLYYRIITFLPGETAMRLFSIACGVGTVITTYYLAKHLFSRQVGSVAALLVAISPYFLQSSFEIRAYSLLGFLSTLCILMLIQKRWWAWAILSVAIPWIEHVGFPLVVGMLVYTVITEKPDDTFSAERDNHFTKMNWWPSIAWLFLLPYCCLLAMQMKTDENPLDPTKWIYLTQPLLYVKKLIGLLVHINVGYRYSMMTVEQIPWREWWFYVLVLASIAMLYYAAVGFRRCQHPVKWLIFAPMVLLFYPTKLHARYLVEIAPLYYCLVAGGLSCRILSR